MYMYDFSFKEGLHRIYFTDRKGGQDFPPDDYTALQICLGQLGICERRTIK